MGTTVLLSQPPAATELLVIDLVTQQDPESDPQLSCRCHFCFPQAFLHQLLLIKTLQLRIFANRMPHRFTCDLTCMYSYLKTGIKIAQGCSIQILSPSLSVGGRLKLRGFGGEPPELSSFAFCN
jgi:hypothetical protein